MTHTRSGGRMIDGVPSWKLPEYKIWSAMCTRCTNTKHVYYHYYADKDIRVCDEWSGRGGFLRFLDHVGRRPTPQHSIDRINNDGDYEPGNVRWATHSEQMSNRGTFVTGEKHGNTRLNDWQVRIIKWCRLAGMRNTDLAEIFRVGNGTVQRAVERSNI